MTPMDSDHSKNMILAVVLSIVIIMGWQVVDNYRLNGDFTDFSRPIGPERVQQDAQTGGEAHENLLPTPLPTDGSFQGSQNPAQQASGQVTEQGMLLGQDARSRALELSPRVLIETPRLSGSLALTGARLDDLTMKDYQTDLDPESPLVSLLHPSRMVGGYFAEFGWVASSGISLTLPDAETLWQADRDVLAPGSPVTLRWTNPENVTFNLIFDVDANFLFTVTQNISGLPSQIANAGGLYNYGRIFRDGTPNDISSLYILHEGLIGVLNDGLEEIDYDDLNESDSRMIRFAETTGWLGITDKYWLTALSPASRIDQGQEDVLVQQPFQASMQARPRNQAPVFMQDLPVNITPDFGYQTDVLSPFPVSSGGSGQASIHLFAGAKQTLLLDQYEQTFNIGQFDLAVDFGWFYFLTKPIFYALHWLNGFLGNFGLAILALTVFVKALLFPLANKSYHSMSKMKLLQPKMMELREKFGDDKMKLNQAMMELYKTEKVNPLSGCLPILIQIPVFFSLYKVLYITIEMRHAPFFGWIHDLSAPDPLGMLTLFGLIPWDVPQILAIINIGIWPILMGLSMWLQMRLNPTPADPIQQKIFTFMPLIFTFMLAPFAAGLVIYWTWNNTLSIIQQYIIMRRMGVPIGGSAEAPAQTPKEAPSKENASKNTAEPKPGPSYGAVKKPKTKGRKSAGFSSAKSSRAKRK